MPRLQRGSRSTSAGEARLRMRLPARCGPGPQRHPATQCDYPMGGRVGEWAGAASQIALPRFLKQTPSTQHRCNAATTRSEEHTSELQSLMRISYAVFCLKKKKKNKTKVQ